MSACGIRGLLAAGWKCQLWRRFSRRSGTSASPPTPDVFAAPPRNVAKGPLADISFIRAYARSQFRFQDIDESLYRWRQVAFTAHDPADWASPDKFRHRKDCQRISGNLAQTNSAPRCVEKQVRGRDHLEPQPG